TQLWQDEVPTGTAAVLGHRRLSILDLSPAGHQPMASPDSRYWISYNGEVYNHVELRETLETLGHRFLTRSDTEVILAAFAEWGPGCLNRFKGMWAFIVVDTVARRVFVARDPFGIKPLYLATLPDGLAMASETKALLELSGVARRVDPSVLHHYLAAGICDQGEATMLAGIRQLPAAHYLEFALDKPGSPQPVRYWRIDLSNRLDLSFTEAAAQLRERFLESIRLHLRSDVPVGGALSGGIDSSAVVGAMRHVEGPDLKLHTFSYVADDAALSEERWMDIASGSAGAITHKTWPSPQELAAELETLVHVQDLPFASTSIYAQHRVFREAQRAGIKVMLDGQGADEMLAGYFTYMPFRMQTWLAQGRLWEMLAFARAAAQLPGGNSIGHQALKLLLPAPLATAMSNLRGGQGLTQRWLNQAWFDARSASPYVEPCLAGPEYLREQLLNTLETTSLPALLRYEDRNSMAHSIESRVPFLLPDLAEFTLALPDTHLLSAQGQTKSVFRAALRGIVPDAILDRQDKIGFETPQKRWLLSIRPWVETVLGSETARRIPALNVPAMQAAWLDLAEGRCAYDGRYWRWINLISWSERYGIAYD
ncbi:MAG: asparagine synthase (glutamine-hydrolyzing), partial [Candidatus Sericytochromatia bacterium]|nr:asparagine synthase (glutamine-hydrolyzing) [Candidatus Sericytochromatia bacterium]